jgi:galacturan 1,4-alpha-galacturonidase
MIKSMPALFITVALFLATSTQALLTPPNIPAPMLRSQSPPLPNPRPRFPPDHAKTCKVYPSGDGKDDAPALLDAAKRCNHGGRVVLPAGHQFTIGSPLDLTFLDNVDLVFSGNITFTDNTTYWQENEYYMGYQNTSTFWLIGGKDVNVYGGGVIDGNGQAWYDLYAQNSLILRPILMYIYGLRGGSVSDLTMINSPQYHNMIVNSTDLVYSNIFIQAVSTSDALPKNTDGFDTYRSDNIVIKDSKVNNGDDCVSFRANSTNVLVTNLHCNGSHGISVGSVGQYPTKYDIVENIYVSNIYMAHASDGARVKAWPGVFSGDQWVDLQGGGGAGYVKNVTYDNFLVNSVDYAIEVTQCYGQTNVTLCAEYPSKVEFTDIKFTNFRGTTSGANKNVVTTIICSEGTLCSNISASNISVTCPTSDGSPKNICDNVDTSLLQYTCSTS